MATDPTRTTSLTDLSAVPNPCEDAGSLLAKAERCRRLSAGISDRQTSDVLNRMAVNYEDAAARLSTGD